jgi:phosphoribosyl-dephospho-CoA transferase
MKWDEFKLLVSEQECLARIKTLDSKGEQFLTFTFCKFGVRKLGKVKKDVELAVMRIREKTAEYGIQIVTDDSLVVEEIHKNTVYIRSFYVLFLEDK